MTWVTSRKKPRRRASRGACRRVGDTESAPAGGSLLTEIQHACQTCECREGSTPGGAGEARGQPLDRLGDDRRVNGLTVERRPGDAAASLSSGAQKVERPLLEGGRHRPAATRGAHVMPGSRSKLPSGAPAYGKLASAPDVLSAADDRGRLRASARQLAQPLRASPARSSPRR